MIEFVEIRKFVLSMTDFLLVLSILLEDKQKFKCGEVDKVTLYSYCISRVMLIFIDFIEILRKMILNSVYFTISGFEDLK